MRFFSAILLLLASPYLSMAQDSPRPRWALEISGQANFVGQSSANLHSPYTGTNSFPAGGNVGFTQVATLFTHISAPGNTDVEVDLETASGTAIGYGRGLGSFINAEIPRDPSLAGRPYISRLVVHHSMVNESVKNRGQLDFYLGQFNASDWFDGSLVGSDPHTQFINGGMVNNLVYDYAACTRGLVVQWTRGPWELRAGEMMLPSTPDTLHLSWSWKTHSENLEVQRHTSLHGRNGSWRMLAFINHGAMGSYRQAVAATPEDRVPDISKHRHGGAAKYGLAASFEHELTSSVRGFVRIGWNEGRNESFLYAEANTAMAAGIDVRYGKHWQSGVAIAESGLSAEHRQYLARGGMGFLLGDGRLNYGIEQAIETYTAVNVGNGFNVALDLQYIANPGYNRDRGPVWVPGFRVHWDTPKWRKSL